MILQRDIIQQCNLSKVASVDACRRIVKNLVDQGHVERHKDKKNHNAVYFSEPHGEAIKAALEAEFQRRQALLATSEAAAAGDDEETPPELGPNEDPAGKRTQERLKEKAEAQPTGIKDLAAAEGPKKRTPAKKEGAKPPTKKREAFKFPANLWIWLAVGGVLLLGVGWWRQRQARATDIATAYTPPPDQTNNGLPQPGFTLSDTEQLKKWNGVFEGI